MGYIAHGNGTPRPFVYDANGVLTGNSVSGTDAPRPLEATFTDRTEGRDRAGARPQTTTFGPGLRSADNGLMSALPSVLVFDVNETLLDIKSMAPLFEQIFDDARVLREWFGLLVIYSMTITQAGRYVDYFTLGQGLLRMLGDVHGVDITEQNVGQIRNGMLTMPAHPDVADGLTALRNHGFRLVTLTNSPANPAGPTPLEHAGLSRFFERTFSVDAVAAFKPAPQVYRFVCHELSVVPAQCMMVAAHVWDLIGARSVGFSDALITREGNAPLPVDGLPQPAMVASDLGDLGRQLCGPTGDDSA